ncbi:two-component system sensor histidine kinase NtrB [Robiginitomaculum antarcticum]|uniref:two-component system sensor histidine kinase NtrB n=1 Tax=Robiginitomaculum antarcticum TaxID=437507 RepID=UPI00036773A5|nr:ATP-binding protein [Robiginitomaculum antarcticum]
MVELKDIHQLALMDDLPIAIVIITQSDHKIQWLNNHAELWLQRSRQSLLNKSLSELTENPELLALPISRVSATGGPVIAEDIALRRADEANTLCHLTAFPVGNNVALIIREEPAGRVTGRSLQDSDAVEALGRMLAHELKNPLAGIKGAAQLLASEAKSDEAKELIALITTETDRIRRLADRMEAFGSISMESLEAVNIHTVLRQTRLLAQSMNGEIAFNENYDPSLPDVSGNRDALMQVTLNIIKNALEAIVQHKTGNEITLQTAYRAGMSRSETGRKLALPVEIRITDNGPGIPGHIRSQLFHPFVTDKPAGRGLGLTLVSKIIHAHGGIIEVSSKPGKTVFSILLPAYQNRG